MPNKSKRQIQSSNATQGHWLSDSQVSSDESNYLMHSSEEEDVEVEYVQFTEMIQINDIVDLFEFRKKKLKRRYLSVLLYMTLRWFNISYGNAHRFLQSIGGLTDEVTHNCADVFINGNFCDFANEGRDGIKESYFYEAYPELKRHQTDQYLGLQSIFQ